MKAHSSRITAFSMVEVSLALGIASFCFIAIFGLLPSGLKSHQTAIEQTAAMGILSAVAADLRATPSSSGTSNQFQIVIPQDPAMSGSTVLYFTNEGNFDAQFRGDARYRLTSVFQSNSGTSGNHMATLVDLRVSWPSMLPPEQANGCAQIFVALNRN